MTTRTEAGGRRIRWTPVALTLLGAVVLVGLFVILMQGMSQGSTALSAVKEQTTAGLARETEQAAAADQTLDVTWSTTPQPDGDSDTVLVRLEAQPSGASKEANFFVTDGEVTAMDALARQLLSSD